METLLWIYFAYALWFHGWMCAIDLRYPENERASAIMSVILALAWPLVLWKVYQIRKGN